jgi:hypothetical protein
LKEKQKNEASYLQEKAGKRKKQNRLEKYLVAGFYRYTFISILEMLVIPQKESSVYTVKMK